MWRLLRRIVLLGITLDKAYTNWKGKQKVVEERQNEVNSAIATLRSAGEAEEADKVKNTVDNVMKAVENVRKATTNKEGY